MVFFFFLTWSGIKRSATFLFRMSILRGIPFSGLEADLALGVLFSSSILSLPLFSDYNFLHFAQSRHSSSSPSLFFVSFVQTTLQTALHGHSFLCFLKPFFVSPMFLHTSRLQFKHSHEEDLIQIIRILHTQTDYSFTCGAACDTFFGVRDAQS